MIVTIRENLIGIEFVVGVLILNEDIRYLTKCESEKKLRMRYKNK